MTTNSKTETVFPTRGVAGGWRDCWDDDDDSARLRAQAEAAERWQMRRAEILGVVWQGEIRAQRQERGPSP